MPEEPANLLDDAAAGLDNNRSALLAALAEHGETGRARIQEEAGSATARQQAVLEAARAQGVAGGTGFNAAENRNDDFAELEALRAAATAGVRGRREAQSEANLSEIGSFNDAFLERLGSGAQLQAQELDAYLVAQRAALDAQAAAAAARGGGGGGGGGGGAGPVDLSGFQQQFPVARSVGATTFHQQTTPEQAFALSNVRPANLEALQETGVFQSLSDVALSMAADSDTGLSFEQLSNMVRNSQLPASQVNDALQLIGIMLWGTAYPSAAQQQNTSQARSSDSRFGSNRRL